MLRMGLVVFDRRPLEIIAVTVKSGKDHRTLVEPGDDQKELGHCGNPSGQSGGDHRIAWRSAAPTRGLAFQQVITPRRRVEGALLGENPRPMLRQDLE